MTINLPKIPFKIILIAVIGLLVLGGIGGTFFFYNRYQKIKILMADPEAVSKAETDAVVAKLKKLMVLPEGERPSVATILDMGKLKDQPFFARAENGDKALIYNSAKIAILYSPKKNLVLNVSPIAAAPESQNLKVVLYNGTNTAGLTQTAEDKIKSTHKELEIIKRANAAKNDYANSIVIDLTGANAQIAASLSAELKGAVSSLPEGEAAPQGADILVILGADYAI